MIFGIGTDIVKTERLRAAVDRWGDRFLRRVFTEDEISYSYGKKDPFLSLSARFAAKEALIKAIGRRAAFGLSDIEIINNEDGGPSIRPRGGLKAYFDSNNLGASYLSMSHEREYSIAFVVVEK
ncbi:MAG: holo-ACP synthase [Nitrospirae bacterium]|nr:holo-ACP synthase [Nitrospirota bacterium]